jgi:hypothetical protein
MTDTKLSDIDYFIAVGKLVNNAVGAEAMMFTTFRILTGCPRKIAGTIFYTHESFFGKKSLLKRTVDEIGDDEDKQLVKALIEAANTANNQRREVSHTILMSATKDGKDQIKVIRPRNTDPSKPLTKNFVAPLLSQSLDACAKGHRVLEKICQKHGKPLILEIR